MRKPSSEAQIETIPGMSAAALEAASQSRFEKDRYMQTASDFHTAVTVTDRASMQRQLDEAVSAAKAQAMGEGSKGILVTRHGYGSFTVALSDAVPFGLTRELQAW
jgi:hypothetical protein